MTSTEGPPRAAGDWVARQAGGGCACTPGLNKAVHRGTGVGPVRSEARGLGRWRACMLVLQAWVWLEWGGHLQAAGGSSTPSSAIPAAFRPS